MKAVIQRVKQAEVKVGEETTGAIGTGLLVLLGVGKEDTESSADELAAKLEHLRIFNDPDGKMNLSATDIQAEFLVVSQFTLFGDCRKGRRPSFDSAGPPDKARELYDYFVTRLRNRNFKVETGRFAAMMDVSLVNDGPVTIIIDT